MLVGSLEHYVRNPSPIKQGPRHGIDDLKTFPPLSYPHDKLTMTGRQKREPSNLVQLNPYMSDRPKRHLPALISQSRHFSLHTLHHTQRPECVE
jgi:hypothetical protein